MGQDRKQEPVIIQGLGLLGTLRCIHTHTFFFSWWTKPHLEWSRWIRASPSLVYFFSLRIIFYFTLLGRKWALMLETA